MKRHIIKTSDGSSTIKIDEMDETYHSSHGAIQEAEHVFIEHGVNSIKAEELKIFEMGFGTGLNALLTLKHVGENDRQVEYHAIEAFPVESELLEQLNYVDQIGEKFQDSFSNIHKASWGELTPITKSFSLEKIHAKIETLDMPEAEYDLVFFDAFGPRAQSKMWALDVLTKMYKGLKENGVLVTYCAQGQFKRNLKSLGFKVESLPGPPGKREMTRAVKQS